LFSEAVTRRHKDLGLPSKDGEFVTPVGQRMRLDELAGPK